MITQNKRTFGRPRGRNGGRKPKPENEKRSVLIKFVVTKDEAKQITKLAKPKTISEYLRTKALS